MSLQRRWPPNRICVETGYFRHFCYQNVQLQQGDGKRETLKLTLGLQSQRQRPPWPGVQGQALLHAAVLDVAPLPPSPLHFLSLTPTMALSSVLAIA